MPGVSAAWHSLRSDLERLATRRLAPSRNRLLELLSRAAANPGTLADAEASAALVAFSKHSVVDPTLAARCVRRARTGGGAADAVCVARAAALGRGGAAETLRQALRDLNADGAAPLAFESAAQQVDFVWGCTVAGVAPAPQHRLAAGAEPLSAATAWALAPRSAARLLWCCAKRGQAGNALFDAAVAECVAWRMEGFTPGDAGMVCWAVVAAQHASSVEVVRLATEAAAASWHRPVSADRVRAACVTDVVGVGSRAPFYYATLLSSAAEAGVYAEALLEAVAREATKDPEGLRRWKPQHLLSVVQACAVRSEEGGSGHRVLTCVEHALEEKDSLPLFVGVQMQTAWIRATGFGEAPPALSRLLVSGRRKVASLGRDTKGFARLGPSAPSVHNSHPDPCSEFANHTVALSP
eukprot:Rhum_TRINITY_DN12998_c0_g1::Rhum_TRINITY_DN12998_c0_g1_i1::g.55978::m.55978